LKIILIYINKNCIWHQIKSTADINKKMLRNIIFHVQLKPILVVKQCPTGDVQFMLIQ